jgi:hypothetical protein
MTPDELFEERLQDLEIEIDEAVLAVAQHANEMQQGEETITSRIAQAIKGRLNRTKPTAAGWNIEVYFEEFSKTEESRSGADMFISITANSSGNGINKGLLVQSKKRESLRRADERRRLRNQCNRMRTRAPDGSYVMVIDGGDVLCREAPKSSDPVLQDLNHHHKSVGELVADGFRCIEGSQAIKIDTSLPIRRALRDALDRLSTPLGLAFVARRG